MLKWKLERWQIKDLIEHPKNPRYLSKDQAKHLGKSIDKFGLIDKPIINQDGMIIGGHQRIKLLHQMDEEEIDCWVPNRCLTDEEINELNIRLNKNTGDWDWDILANEWNYHDLLEWGFTAKELETQEESEDIEEEHCPNCGKKMK